MISILNFSCLQISRTDVSIYSDINESFVILEGSGGGKRELQEGGGVRTPKADSR